MNHTCSCGPYFDPRKVKAMPGQFGTGPISNVAREIFQAFLMAALNPRQMLNLLKRGEGEFITLTLESKPTTVRIPVFVEIEDFYTYIRRQLEELCVCEYLLSKRKESCNKCIINAQAVRNNDESNSSLEKRRWSADNQQNSMITISSTATSQQKQDHSQIIGIPTTQSVSSVTPSPPKQPRKSLPGKIYFFFF